MKVSITMEDFPVLLFEMFKEDLAKYVDANVQLTTNGTVFVTFCTDDVAKAQCGIIVCDRYKFKGDGSDVCEILH